MRGEASKALIVGLAGPRLLPAEAAFLAAHRPCGLIVFARNVETPAQLTRLIGDARGAIGGGEILVLVDQEGGRVQRLRPPHWRALPAARAFAGVLASDPALADEMAYAIARLAAEELSQVGINCNCAPVLDVPVDGAHDVIGDRAYATRAADVARLAEQVARGLSDGGVVPVLKHIPGHGRALGDSHHELPVVRATRGELEATDFAPFRALAAQPAAMTAHVVYPAIDASAPGSTSVRVIGEIVRGAIGFDGLLMSDDLSMRALSGTIAERAAAVISAGCDVALHCNGMLQEMMQAAASVPLLSGRSLARLHACLHVTRRRTPFDAERAEALRASLVELAA